MATTTPAPVGSARHLGLTLERIASAVETIVEQTRPTDPDPTSAESLAATYDGVVLPAVVETPITLVDDPVIDESAVPRPTRKRAVRSTKAAA